MSGITGGSLAMRRGLAVLGAVVTLTAADGASAQGRRHAALVMDANTGRVISESGANEPRHPASLTKMMTLYVVFELIEQGKLRYDTRITFSEAATRVQPTKLGVPAGGSVTVLEAAKSLITKSANDASVALAEHIAGSEAKFAAVMTRTARRIGMPATTFRNAHGLHDPEQVTTARDMVTLGLRLQDDFPKHYPLFATREFSHAGATHRNHNTMLLTYEGTDGIKTGYIGASGFNLVANVKRGDKHVIGVVFGGASAGSRNATMKTLLNLALFKASATKTRQPAARARPPASAEPIASAIAVPAPVAAARPTLIPAPRAAEPPAQPRVVTAAPRPAAPPPAAITVAGTEPAIQVARVKPLLVAPRQPKQAPLPVAAPPSPQPTAATAPIIQPPPLATTFAPSPRTQIAATLPAAAASRLNGPAVGGIHLQVGAFASQVEAERHLTTVKGQAGSLLQTYPSLTTQGLNNGKIVYRARFSGVDRSDAGRLCNELRRRNIDCLAAKAE